ncbi:MAG: ribosome small subunit-dependent GTPase A [Hydrogenovibrio sp.]|uniref:ribosome small subunit-dependent GTPase A n=1 Tax=Hydrogenovibrio sp. TaxID=2065821 RepID=UPI002870187C|nr:ribosome small subunit-dependent GTPase A [Hydrogenovibrio sp.]MDR9498108.1 ribosome small subunit-dependent GTPase A [Hydrogenovibrio sp.]
MAQRKLSKQQKRRLDQRRFKTSENRPEDDPDAKEENGVVVTHHGRSVLIENAQQQLILCAVRQNLGKLVAGDRVCWQAEIESGTGVVTALQPRTSLMTRPGFRGQTRMIAANIDRLIITLGVEPGVHPDAIDRYLVAASQQKLPCLLVINKMDLVDSPELQELILERLAPYPPLIQHDRIQGLLGIHFTSTEDNTGLEALRDDLAGHTSVIVGPSGAGKSSLIKALIPDLSIRVQSLSDATGLGKHTTSNSVLYHLPDQSGQLIDSPGVRQFDPEPMPLHELEQAYPDFFPFLGQCRFDDCTHQHEPQCAIRDAVENDEIAFSRYQSFQRLLASFS